MPSPRWCSHDKDLRLQLLQTDEDFIIKRERYAAGLEVEVEFSEGRLEPASQSWSLHLSNQGATMVRCPC